MNLDEAQKKTVESWIAAGLKLSEIQTRLGSELGIHMTYMDVRLLVDDLKLTPKDVDRPKPQEAAMPASPGGPGAAKPGGVPAAQTAPSDTTSPAAGKLSISVDQLARPGAMVSGKVTFSDGNKAEWYFDEMGRLGLAPQQRGYRPPPAEIQQFQAALEQELGKLGL